MSTPLNLLAGSNLLDQNHRLRSQSSSHKPRAGKLFSLQDTQTAIPLVIKDDQGQEVDIVKAMPFGYGMVALTVNGTAHLYYTDTNEWLSVDVGGNFITDIHSSVQNVFLTCEKGIYAVSYSNSWGQIGVGSFVSCLLSSYSYITLCELLGAY